jgi:hypothetical protein
MIDIRRMNAEIRMLQDRLGRDRIVWPRDYKWVYINGFRLPSGFKKDVTNAVVLIPDQYGNGAALRDAFLDPDLKAYNRSTGRYEAMPHYFKEYPYAKLDLGSKAEWARKRWQYICIHMEKGKAKGTGILTYLDSLYAFLTDPFRDWGDTFASYKR